MATQRNCDKCGYVPIRPENTLLGRCLKRIVSLINGMKERNDHSYREWIEKYKDLCTGPICDYKFTEEIDNYKYSHEIKYRFGASMASIIKDLSHERRMNFYLEEPEPNSIFCARCNDQVFCVRLHKEYKWRSLIAREMDDIDGELPTSGDEGSSDEDWRAGYDSDRDIDADEPLPKVILELCILVASMPRNYDDEDWDKAFPTHVKEICTC